MERRSEEESTGSDSSTSGAELSVVDAIKAIAAHNARADIETEAQMMLFLQSWWSRTFNKPLKDPILQTYTLEELLYEFYDRIERQKAAEERADEETDRIELDKEQADEDWAEKQERLDLEKEAAASAAKSKPAQAKEEPAQDPTKDPQNVKWMEEQLRLAKKLHGDTFGEDIDESFDG